MRRKHDHKYYRVNKAREENTPWLVYECRREDCTHSLPIVSIIGKRSLCWDCGEPFVMDEHSLQIKPRCHRCRSQRPYHKTKKKEYRNDLAEVTGYDTVDMLMSALLPKGGM